MKTLITMQRYQRTTSRYTWERVWEHCGLSSPSWKKVPWEQGGPSALLCSQKCLAHGRSWKHACWMDGEVQNVTVRGKDFWGKREKNINDQITEWLTLRLRCFYQDRTNNNWRPGVRVYKEQGHMARRLEGRSHEPCKKRGFLNQRGRIIVLKWPKAIWSILILPLMPKI